MDNGLEKINELVPELVPLYIKRIDIMHWIYREGPIGRKFLAEKMGMTERPLRAETEFLKRQQFIYSTPKGMMLTAKGEDALIEGQTIWRQQSSTYSMEQRLKKFLNVDQVKIVNGNADEDRYQNYEMALQVSQYLNHHLPQGQHSIAITGGRTMLEVAKNLQKSLSHQRDFTVVAARGGLGDQVATQANTVSDLLAQRLKGKNIGLYAPEKISENTYLSLLTEPSIQHTLRELKRANILLFSVGDAKIMAERREVDGDEAEIIRNSEAVGEAFGCFFDKEGRIVYRLPRIGFQIEDLSEIEMPILVAGGASKANAIEAFVKLAPKQLILITDKGAAEMVLNGETH